MSARIAIIGAGISGLAAAHRLRELDSSIELTVFEASARAGGLFQSERRDGFVIEHGPDSILTEKPWALRLAERLGLQDEMISTRTEVHGAYVVCRGQLERIPDGFSLMAPARWEPTLRSPILSARGKARLLMEPMIPPDPPHDDESLASFVRRRLGSEVLERLAQPLVGGIYGSDPEQLSLHATMPRFVRLEQQYGSVVRGLQRSAGNREASGVRYGMFFSFKSGMQTFTDTLFARLRAHIRLNTRVEAIDVGAEGHTLRLTGGEQTRFDAVIVALPGNAAGQLLASVEPELGRALSAIEHGSTATISYAWPRAEIPHPLDAYGFVVPHAERRAIMACTFSAQKWEGRTPAGYALIRAFFGGHADPFVTQRSDHELVQSGLRELGALLGITSPPTFFRIARQHHAMPQYTLGHVRRAEAIEARIAAVPRLALAGNALRGVGIPDAVREGEQAVERLLAAMGLRSEA